MGDLDGELGNRLTNILVWLNGYLGLAFLVHEGRLKECEGDRSV